MKKPGCAALKKKLDNVFSLYIRHRDRGVCYTCGVQKMPSEMQNGHYISRVCLALRYDEINNNCQCYSCNCMKHGDLVTYREHLVKDYGEDVVKDLEARRHETVKHSPDWYHQMITHYQGMLKHYERL